MKTKHSRKKQKLRNPVASFMNDVNRAATYVDRKKAMKASGVGRRGQWLDMIELFAA